MLVAFDSRLIEGTTYRVVADGRVVDQFESTETRRCTVTLLTQNPFSLSAVDPEIVPAPSRAEDAAIAEDEPRPTWRRARWVDIASIEQGSYVLKYGPTVVALVLGPWED